MVEKAEEFQQQAEKKYFDFKNQNENEKFQLNTELKSKNIKITTLNTRLASQEQTLKEMEVKLEKLLQENSESKLKELELLRISEQQKENLQDLSQKHNHKESIFEFDVKEMEKRYRDQNSKLATDYKKTIEGLEEKLFQLQEEVLFLTQAKNQAQQQLEILQKKYKECAVEQDEDINAIKEKNAYLQQKITIVEEQLKENRKETQEMVYLYEKKVQDKEVLFERERENFREKIFSLQKDYQQEANEVKSFQRQIFTARKEKREKNQQFLEMEERFHQKLVFFEKQVQSYEQKIASKEQER